MHVGVCVKVVQWQHVINTCISLAWPNWSTLEAVISNNDNEWVIYQEIYLRSYQFSTLFFTLTITNVFFFVLDGTFGQKEKTLGLGYSDGRASSDRKPGRWRKSCHPRGSTVIWSPRMAPTSVTPSAHVSHVGYGSSVRCVWYKAVTCKSRGVRELSEMCMI